MVKHIRRGLNSTTLSGAHIWAHTLWSAEDQYNHGHPAVWIYMMHIGTPARSLERESIDSNMCVATFVVLDVWIHSNLPSHPPTPTPFPLGSAMATDYLFFMWKAVFGQAMDLFGTAPLLFFCSYFPLRGSPCFVYIYLLASAAACTCRLQSAPVFWDAHHDSSHGTQSTFLLACQPTHWSAVSLISTPLLDILESGSETK